MVTHYLLENLRNNNNTITWEDNLTDRYSEQSMSMNHTQNSSVKHVDTIEVDRQNSMSSSDGNQPALGGDAEGGSKDVKDETKIVLDLFLKHHLLKEHLRSNHVSHTSRSHDFSQSEQSLTTVRRNNSEPHAKFYGVKPSNIHPDGTSQVSSRYMRRGSSDIKRNVSAPHSSNSTLDSLEYGTSPGRSTKTKKYDLKKRRTNSFIKAQRNSVVTSLSQEGDRQVPQILPDRIIGRREKSFDHTEPEVSGVRKIDRSDSSTYRQQPSFTIGGNETVPRQSSRGSSQLQFIHERGGSEPIASFHSSTNLPEEIRSSTALSGRKDENKISIFLNKFKRKQTKHHVETSSHPHQYPRSSVTATSHPNHSFDSTSRLQFDTSDSAKGRESSESSTKPQSKQSSEGKRTPKILRRFSQKKTKKVDDKHPRYDSKSTSLEVVNKSSEPSKQKVDKSNSLPHDMRYSVQPPMTHADNRHIHKKDGVEMARKKKKRKEEQQAKRPTKLDIPKKKGFKAFLRKLLPESSSSSSDEEETKPTSSMPSSSFKGRKPPPPTPAASSYTQNSVHEVRKSASDRIPDRERLQSMSSDEGTREPQAYRSKYHHRPSHSVNDLDRNDEFYEQIVDRLRRIAEQVIRESPHQHNESEEENLQSSQNTTKSAPSSHDSAVISRDGTRKGSDSGALNAYFRLKDKQSQNKKFGRTTNSRAPQAHKTRHPKHLRPDAPTTPVGQFPPPSAPVKSSHSPTTRRSHMHMHFNSASLDSALPPESSSMRSWVRKVSEEVRKTGMSPSPPQEAMNLLGAIETQIEHQDQDGLHPRHFEFHGNFEAQAEGRTIRGHLDVQEDALPIRDRSSESSLDEDADFGEISPPHPTAIVRRKSSKKKTEAEETRTEVDLRISEEVFPDNESASPRPHTSLEEELDNLETYGAVGGRPPLLHAQTHDDAVQTDDDILGEQQRLAEDELIEQLTSLLKSKGDEYNQKLPDGINEDIMRRIGDMGMAEFREFANRLLSRVIYSSHRGPCRHEDLLQVSVIMSFTQLFYQLVIPAADESWFERIKKKAQTLIDPIVQRYGTWANLLNSLIETERHLTPAQEYGRQRDGSNVDGDSSSSERTGQDDLDGVE